MGAPDPREGKALIKKVFWTQEQADNHWAYQPIAKTVPPIVMAISLHIDRFIRNTRPRPAPAKPADKRLIRERTGDLIVRSWPRRRLRKTRRSTPSTR